MDGWWENIDLKNDLEGYKPSWFERAVFKTLCRSNKTLYSFSKEGYVKNPDKLINYLESLEDRKIIEINLNETFSQEFIFPWGLVIVTSCCDDDTYRYTASSVDKTLAPKIKEQLDSYFEVVPPTGSLKMLNLIRGEYHLVDIGKINHKFEKKNYSSDVHVQYDHILEELGDKNPCGRFVLLAGEPGTGKSYFIRGLLSEMSGWFVFIPASLVGSLSGPEIVSTLLRTEDRNDRPIVLIIEDADSSLVQRDDINLNKVSDLLNLSDGLLGELSDIRIFATTNAKKIDIDKALLRPGRLCTHVHFNKLTKEKASGIYKRLTKKSYKGEGNITLAELYRIARGDGWKPKSVEKTIGFASPCDVPRPR